MSSATPEALQQSVVRWCTEEGFQVDAAQQGELAFAVSVQRPDRPLSKIAITQAAAEAKLVAASGVRFDPSTQARLEALSPPSRAALIRDLAWLLNTQPVSFQVDQDDLVLKHVLIAKVIYDDGLTKNSLMGALSDLMRATSLVKLQIDKTLGGLVAPGSAAATPGAEPKAATCTNCGQALKAGAAFCTKCGASVTAASASSPSGQTQYSADGKWFWTGAQWVPTKADSGSPSVGAGPASSPSGQTRYSADGKWFWTGAQWVPRTGDNG